MGVTPRTSLGPRCIPGPAALVTLLEGRFSVASRPKPRCPDLFCFNMTWTVNSTALKIRLYYNSYIKSSFPELQTLEHAGAARGETLAPGKVMEKVN